MRRLKIVAASAALLISLAFFANRASAAEPDVDEIIGRAKAYLYSKQAGGNWEAGNVGEVMQGQKSGLTALTTYALLCTGESQNDPRLKAAIDFVAGTKTTGTYALGVRCLLWGSIDLKGPRRQAALADRDQLLTNMRAGPAKGLYWYQPPVKGNMTGFDLSCSQFPPLGLAALARKSIEVPTPFWKTNNDAFRALQNADGSWQYNSELKPSVNMTASGVASLLIAQEFMARPESSEPIDKGIAWIGSHLQADLGPIGWPTYGLFGVSRIGVECGLKRFGDTDWYKVGLTYLAQTQVPDGRWEIGLPSPADTDFATLFLAYGSAPIVINKLRYTNSGADAGHWNKHPRDCLNFIQWMSSQVERRLNWQVVDLTRPEDLRDAPILYIFADEPLTFSEPDKAKLRNYVEQGGLIVGDASSVPEIDSLKQLGKALFPAYDFRQLGPDDPLFRNDKARRLKPAGAPGLLGISNGARELIVIPADDLSSPFQHRANVDKPSLYQLAYDIALYATDSRGLHRKGKTYLVDADPAVPTNKSVKIVRLQYDGNWNPEPAGWTRLAAILHNTCSIAVAIQTVKLGGGTLNAPGPSADQLREQAVKRCTPAEMLAAGGDRTKFDALIDAKIAQIKAEQANSAQPPVAPVVAHLTGTGKFTLTDAQRKELATFVDNGGTLVIDSAGGSHDFSDSATIELIHLFGGDATRGMARPLPLTDPLYTNPDHPITEVHYRDFAVAHGISGKDPTIFGIPHGGRTAVYFSREDLSAGLVGQQVDGIIGCTPESATELMRNVILASLHGN